jgi:hypothetical protein
MPRIVEVTLPPNQTNELIARVKQLDHVISIRIQRNISLKPPGDVVAIGITNRSLSSLLMVLDELGLTYGEATSVSGSRPEFLMSRSETHAIRADSSESNWEEMENSLNSESTMTFSSCVTMAISGMIATCGLMTNAIHLVAGAMVIAPGFEPISRIALGIVTQNATWKRGATDTAKGYLSLIAGAALSVFLLKLLGYEPPDSQGTYLPEGVLLQYWTSTSSVALLVSVLAGIAGAILIINHRSVLTAGVMIALALIPAGALVGIGLATGDVGLAGTGASRLLIEGIIVLFSSLLVYGWKRHRSEKRRMRL